MNGNMLTHLAILLTTFSGLADLQGPETDAPSLFGHEPTSETSGRVEREFEKRGNMTEGS